MFGNEIELVFTNEGYAMNTKGKYFHANLLSLAVFAALYPTIGSAANIMYQNGGEHNINDLNAPDCLYVQNNTTVNGGAITVNARTGVESGSTLNAKTLNTQTILLDGGSTITTGSLTLADNAEIYNGSKLIIKDGVFKASGSNTVFIKSGSTLAKDEQGAALDRIELASNKILESEVDLNTGYFTGGYRGRNGTTFHVSKNADMTAGIDLKDDSAFIAEGDITYGGGFNFVGSGAKGKIKAGGNIVFNGKGTFADKNSELSVYANKFILNNSAPNTPGNHNVWGEIHVNEVVADSITNSNFWNGLNVEKLTLRNSTEGNFQVGASSTIGTLTVEEGSQNTIETYSSSSATKTKMAIESLVVGKNATAGFTVTADGSSANIGTHELEINTVKLAEGASFGNTRRCKDGDSQANIDRKVGYQNLYVDAIEAEGNAKVNLDYGVTHVSQINIASNSTLTVGTSGKMPASVSQGTLSANGQSLDVVLNAQSVLSLNAPTADDTTMTVATAANAPGTVSLGNQATLKGEAISVVSAGDQSTGDTQNDLNALAGVVVDAAGDHVAGVQVTQQANELFDEASATTTADGGLTNVTVARNANTYGISEMTTLGLISWRSEINDMNKRLGELRDSSEESNGVWARVYNGKSKYGDQDVTAKYTSFQFGYDRQIVPGTWLGAALSFTDGDNDFKQGSGDTTLYALTGYASWLADNGMFLDVTGKVGRMKNSFDIATNLGVSSGSYHTNTVSMSAEAGWRFYPMQNAFFVEPQVELMYGHVYDADYTTSLGVNVNQDATDSLVGRAGFVLGLKCPDGRGNAYVRASVLHDWKGEASSTFTAGGFSRTLDEDFGDTWYEFGIGVNYNATQNVHLYADVEATANAMVETSYRFNLGVRYAW